MRDFNDHTVTYKRTCKICNSPLRAQIEEMLLSNKTYREVKEFAAEHGLKLVEKNISDHWRNHYQQPVYNKFYKQIEKGEIKLRNVVKEIQDLYELADEVRDVLLLHKEEAKEDMKKASKWAASVNSYIRTVIGLNKQNNEITKLFVPPEEVHRDWKKNLENKNLKDIAAMLKKIKKEYGGE